MTGNLLRTGLPFGTHDTHGWPTFAGWPTNDTNTHQQTYYVWLERAWRRGPAAGRRADGRGRAALPDRAARVALLRRDGTIKARDPRSSRALQDYVDAQSGGPGRGWFRLVYSAGQARRVIEQGKLAVVIGIESSDPFGCSELRRQAAVHARRRRPRPRRAPAARASRSMFIAHWVDNAFAGAALEGGTKGVFINILNRFQTGQLLRHRRLPGPEPGRGGRHARARRGCRSSASSSRRRRRSPSPPMPAYPAGTQCNSQGLTTLGAYLSSG